MTTSADPRGRAQECYTARQSALATAAASPGQTFVKRHFYGLTPSPQSEPQDDDILGGGFHNTMDDMPAAPDLVRASSRIIWPLDLVQIGYVLAELLGAPTTTGTGTYTHTFSSAGVQVPSTTLERKLASGAFDGLVGMVMRSLQFPLGSDRGFTRLNADYFAREPLEQYGSSIAGSPTALTLANRVPRAMGTLKKDGVALGSILSGDITLSNVLGEDNYDGSRYIDDVQIEGRKAAVNLTGRFKNAALRDLGKVAAGAYLPTPLDLEREWSFGVSNKLTLTIRNLMFAVTSVGAEGGGRQDVSLKARAQAGASNPMISAVLVNATASYT